MKPIYFLLIFFALASCSEDDGSEIQDDSTDEVMDGGTFTVSSEAIVDEELLEAFKCESKNDGIENSIPLAWSNIPEGTGSLAVTMHHYPNPDDQVSAPNTYILLWDIDPSVTEIPYGEADDGPWYMGRNKDGNTISYTSPCSPSTGTTAYTITVYALSATPASLPEESTIDVDWDTLTGAIETVTVLGTAVLDFNDVTS